MNLIEAIRMIARDTEIIVMYDIATTPVYTGKCEDYYNLIKGIKKYEKDEVVNIDLKDEKLIITYTHNSLLTDEEKIYLTNLLKPYKDQFDYMMKFDNKGLNFLYFYSKTKDFNFFYLPILDPESYSKLEFGTQYTAEMLELYL